MATMSKDAGGLRRGLATTCLALEMVQFETRAAVKDLIQSEGPPVMEALLSSGCGVVSTLGP